MTSLTENEQLAELREKIAEKTRAIINLVGERNRLAREAGRIKTLHALPVQDEKTELVLFDLVASECEKADVSFSAGFKILNTLLSESKRVQGARLEATQETPMQSFAKAMELQKRGANLIRLDVGEPDFKPPSKVVEATVDALRNSKTRYTQTRGIPELVEALRLYLKSKWNFDSTENQIIITTGGRFAVYSGLASVLSEGESAIIIDPNWPAYKQAIEFVGGRPLTIQTTLEEEWDPPLEALKEAIRPNTKAIVISYPNNPTGKVLDQNTFESIVEIANDNGLAIISDETYIDYSFKKCPSILTSSAEKYICIGSFSKTWAMTGFRVGYAISSRDIVDKMLSIASLMLTSVPEFVQYGAIAALDCKKEAEENRAEMEYRSTILCDFVKNMKGITVYRPDGAMYLFPKFSKIGFSARELADRLLMEKFVSVTPGTAFGNYPNHFRISLGKPTEILLEGLKRIGELLN